MFRSSDKEYSNRYIVSFLKSSVWLWYCMNKFETQNFIPVRMFKESLIPKINLSDPKTKDKLLKIENLVNIIMKKEKEILVNIEKEEKKLVIQVREEKIKKLIEDYNKDVDQYFYQIDKIMYDILDLTDKEINVIENYLRTKKIYIPDSDKNFS